MIRKVSRFFWILSHMLMSKQEQSKRTEIYLLGMAAYNRVHKKEKENIK